MSNLLFVFYWWYFVRVKDFWQSYVIGRFIYNLNMTNTLPMARHISDPLFQDDSGIGKLFGFTIRFIWIGIGSSVSLFVTIPFFLFGVFLLILPLIPIIQLIKFLNAML